MQPFTAAQLLDVWETGRSRPPLAFGVLLLILAYPDIEAASLPFGRFNARLLLLHQHLFGAALESTVSCPQCAEQIEFTVDVADLGIHDEVALPDSIRIEDEVLTLRLPTVGDVLAAGGDADQLFGRIVTTGDATHASAAAQTVAAEQLQALDPLISIVFRLSCPECGHEWEAPLDAAAFVSREIDHWAQRLLHTVHRLASAYGWSERDILAMSAWRRAYYMELVSA